GRARFEPARPRTKAHCAPHFVYAKQFAELIDDPMRRLRIKFGAVGLWQPADVARVLNGGALHAEANAKERHLAIAGVLDGVHHPGNAALSEAPGHEDAIYVTEPALGSLKRVDFLGFDPLDHGAELVGQAAMHQRFAQALVSILELHVFT